jgi:hypothetical protein
MKLDLGMHIGLHLVSFGKSGVTRRQAKKKRLIKEKNSSRATLAPEEAPSLLPLPQS